MRASSGSRARQISELKLSVSATLAAGANVVIPSGRMLFGMIGTGADFVTNTRVEVSIDGGTAWRRVENTGGVAYDGKTDGSFTLFENRLASDGASLRIFNSGGGDVTLFQYIYVEEVAV